MVTRAVGAWWVVGLLFVASCAEGGPPDGDRVSDGEGPTREHVIRVETLVEVEGEVPRVADAVRWLAESRGGWVERADVEGDHAWLTVRVPAAELGSFRIALGHEGEVLRETEEVLDVTEAHEDIEVRLVAAREEEARLRALFADRTAALADVLTVERELSRVREGIERLEAEGRGMRDRAAAAQCFVELRPRAVDFVDAPLVAIGEAGAVGLDVATHLAIGAVVMVAFAAPPALFFAVGILALRRLARRLRS